ncbi:hypothetical protein KIN38_17215 [Vibrio sp. B511a]|uniref:hypothetical protein n=1 Tax=Vibrio TaxID=662 RepID=UPI0024AEC88F|nr:MULTISPECIES: hypothetical protein [Vibrio]MDI7854636.1 hypothetical protein [Vibrio parahaemolyticus]MDK9734469.1 hypothetical protein [Vibrio sp. B511a]
MQEQPIDRITSLFDITSLVDFLVVAGGSIIAFALAKKAFSMVQALIADRNMTYDLTQKYRSMDQEEFRAYAKNTYNVNSIYAMNKVYKGLRRY